jgi:hypothetical protein
MSLFDDASLVLTPNGYKASKLYSIKPTSGLGDMTVVRATTATRVNSAGLIESVAINVPRLDYTLGSCPSILVEPLRTNLVFPSATLTTQTRTVTAVANTLSFYGTGTIVLTGAHTATLTGTGANNRVSLTFTPIAGSLILTVTGTVTNAQLEVGSNASSYIPTTTATVTRNADVISKTGISSLIGQTQGTLYAEVNLTTQTESGLFRRIMMISNGDESTSTYLRITSSNNIAFVSFNGTAQCVINSLSSFNGTIKVAAAYKENDFVFYINGVSQGSDNSGTIPATRSILRIGNSDSLISTHNLNDRIELATLFKTRLTNAQLATLTTP